MAWVALAAVAVSVLSQQKQARSEQAAANYQAQQADADAQAARSAAKVQAQKIRDAGKQQSSQANASLAASGVETGEGTALRITSGITGNAEEDAYTTIINGANAGNRLNAQAQADRISGNNARQAANVNSGGTVLQGGSSMYNGWKRSNPGTTGSTTGGGSSSNMFSNMGIR